MVIADLYLIWLPFGFLSAMVPKTWGWPINDLCTLFCCCSAFFEVVLPPLLPNPRDSQKLVLTGSTFGYGFVLIDGGKGILYLWTLFPALALRWICELSLPLFLLCKKSSTSREDFSSATSDGLPSGWSAYGSPSSYTISSLPGSFLTLSANLF